MPDETIPAPAKPGLSEIDRLEFKRIYKDAKRKADALAGRLRAEYELAESEKRKPFPITPLTEIPAALVVKAIDQIEGEPPHDIQEVVRDQRRNCARLSVGDSADAQITVALLSVQLAAILEAAGLGGE